MIRLVRISGKANFVFSMINLLAKKHGKTPIKDLRIVGA